MLDLLQDIDAFTPGNDGRGWYCLQPLVVHRGTEAEGWRLVDGQQRLTTIKLILTWLDRHYVEELCKQLSSSTQETQGIDQLILTWLGRRDVEGRQRIFSLTYETRGSDKDWLAVLDDEQAARRNIDYWHIRQAWQSICEWFGERGEAFDTYAFSSKLLHRCRFIWYDTGLGGTDNDNEEDVFIRLNDGKIPLTSAELVKALFLNSSNFAGSGDSEAIRLRQLEISSQWDMMEETLADDAFWAFINGRENRQRPRIGYILDIMAGKTDGKGDDDYFTYRHFQRRFDDNERSGDDKRAFVNQLWREVHDTFLALREWYGDKRYYHLTGYLLNTGCHSVRELLDEYRNREKDQFAAWLDTDVSKSIDWDGDEDIRYGDRLQKLQEIIASDLDPDAPVTDDFKRAMLTVGGNDYYNVWGSWSYNFGCAKRWLLDYNEDLYDCFANNDYWRTYLRDLLLQRMEMSYAGIADSYAIPDGMPRWKAKLIKGKSKIDGATYILIPDDQSYCLLSWQQRPKWDDQVKKVK